MTITIVRSKDLTNPKPWRVVEEGGEGSGHCYGRFETRPQAVVFAQELIDERESKETQ